MILLNQWNIFKLLVAWENSFSGDLYPLQLFNKYTHTHTYTHIHTYTYTHKVTANNGKLVYKPPQKNSCNCSVVRDMNSVFNPRNLISEAESFCFSSRPLSNFFSPWNPLKTLKTTHPSTHQPAQPSYAQPGMNRLCESWLKRWW